MSTTTKSRKKPNFPNLPDGDQPGFWLAVFLRSMATCDALKSLHRQSLRNKRSKIVTLALTGAEMHEKRELRNTTKEVVRVGLLPFAHENTTYFAQQGGAA